MIINSITGRMGGRLMETLHFVERSHVHIHTPCILRDKKGIDKWAQQDYT